MRHTTKQAPSSRYRATASAASPSTAALCWCLWIALVAHFVVISSYWISTAFPSRERPLQHIQLLKRFESNDSSSYEDFVRDVPSLQIVILLPLLEENYNENFILECFNSIQAQSLINSTRSIIAISPATTVLNISAFHFAGLINVVHLTPEDDDFSNTKRVKALLADDDLVVLWNCHNTEISLESTLLEQLLSHISSSASDVTLLFNSPTDAQEEHAAKVAPNNKEERDKAPMLSFADLFLNSSSAFLETMIVGFRKRSLQFRFAEAKRFLNWDFAIQTFLQSRLRVSQLMIPVSTKRNVSASATPPSSGDRTKFLEDSKQLYWQSLLPFRCKNADEHTQKPLRVLMIHESLPGEEMGGDIYAMEVLKWFLAQKQYEVYFVGRGHHWYDTDNVERRLRKMGVSFRSNDMYLKHLESLLLQSHKSSDASQQNRPLFDVAVIVVYFWRQGVPSIAELAAPMLRKLSSETSLIALTSDLHFRRNEIAPFWPGCDSIELKRRELSVYRSMDLVIEVSEEDLEDTRKEMLSEDPNGRMPLWDYLPYVSEKISEPLENFGDREGLIYTADSHQGNVLAMKWFFERVFPILRTQIPNIKVLLYGADRWKEFAEKFPSNVKSFGRVRNLQTALDQARVYVNPVFVGGSGVSTKNVLALTSGIPLVSTSFGLRSLCCEHVPNCSYVIASLISGGAEESTTTENELAQNFADRVIDLYTLPEIWRNQSYQQIAFSRRCLSRKVFDREGPLRKLLAEKAQRSLCNELN